MNGQQPSRGGYHNFHTHTSRCKHAHDTDEAYVTTAIEAGYTVLGFADHAPWPYPNGFTSAVRMDKAQLPDYVASIKALRQKYTGQIEVQLGLECEYYPQYLPWLMEQKERYGLDYLILGNHFARPDEQNCHYSFTSRPEQIKDYVKSSIEAMETGLFSYLAHPDVVLASYPVFDKVCADACRELCKAAFALNFPLEYNLLGMAYHDEGRYVGLGYPCQQFWEVAAEYNPKTILGVDAHHACHLKRTDRLSAARELLTRMGLTVVDEIDRSTIIGATPSKGCCSQSIY